MLFKNVNGDTNLVVGFCLCTYLGNILVDAVVVSYVLLLSVGFERIRTLESLQIFIFFSGKNSLSNCPYCTSGIQHSLL